MLRKLRAMGRAAQPVAERRRDLRLTAVFQVAKLVTDRFEELCVVRDISPNGLSAEIYRRVDPGERIGVELRTGHGIAGIVAWRDGAAIGVRFDAPIPIGAMLSHCSFDDRLGHIRPPRLAIAVPSTIEIAGTCIGATTCDVSQAGIKLIPDRALPAGTACRVSLPGMARRAAGVRWQRDGAAGLLFAEPLAYAAFAAWRQSLAPEREALSLAGI